jgi:hypothetical protein
MHSNTKICLSPRTGVFVSKPNNFRKSQEDKFLRQKIKELEDKVDDLKSDAKRRKIFSVFVKKETKQVLAPEMQYRPDSPLYESQSQVLALETQHGPDLQPLEFQPQVLAPERQYGPGEDLCYNCLLAHQRVKLTRKKNC